MKEQSAKIPVKEGWRESVRTGGAQCWIIIAGKTRDFFPKTTILNAIQSNRHQNRLTNV